MRIFLAPLFALSTLAQADTMYDINRTLGSAERLTQQATRILGGVLGGGGNSQAAQSYFPPGTTVSLEDGSTAKIYGSECAPNEAQPCSSIRIDNRPHRVMIISGSSTQEETVRFKQLEKGRLVMIRPNGGFASISN